VAGVVNDTALVLGVPSKRNRGSCEDTPGKMKSKRPFNISTGALTRGAKFKHPRHGLGSVGRFPLLVKDARPAKVDPRGKNQIATAERKVATVAGRYGYRRPTAQHHLFLRRTVTKLQAAMQKQADKAASGDPRALQLLVHLIRDEEKLRDTIKAEYEQRLTDHTAALKSARKKLHLKPGDHR
jgi:hypothetical protein